MTKAIKRIYTQRGWCFLRTSEKLRGIIKFRMDKLGLKQGEIAKAVGVPQYRLSSYLRGMDVPLTQYQLLQVCKYLGINIEMLITFDESLYPQPDILKNLYDKST